MDTSNNLENNVSPAPDQDRSDTQQDFEYAGLLSRSSTSRWEPTFLHQLARGTFDIRNYRVRKARALPSPAPPCKTVEPGRDFTMPGEARASENRAAGFEVRQERFLREEDWRKPETNCLF